MHDLAVVIVTWNVRDLVLDCLKSLYADLEQSGLSAEVVVVDSASADGTPDAIAAAFPQVTLIVSDENLGFGRANNRGLAHLGFGQGQPAESLPPAVYLLNPDTVVHPGSTRALYDSLLADSRVGLAGARLTYGDGSHQHSAFAFPGLKQLWVEFFPTPGRFIEGGFNGRYPPEQYGSNHPFEVDFVLGATMMLRREVIEQTQGFDEDFFMYCEEIDWAWRIHAAGWRVICVPTAHVTHLAGKSTSQAPARSVKNLWESRLRLFNKHYPPWKRWLARQLIIAGMRRKQQQLNHVTADARAALSEAYQFVQQMARSL